MQKETSWNDIDWDNVGTQYNAAIKGIIQKAKWMTASRQHIRGGGKVVSVSQSMKKGRTAPECSPAALKKRIQQFVHTRAEKLVREVREANAHAGDGGESEND